MTPNIQLFGLFAGVEEASDAMKRTEAQSDLSSLINKQTQDCYEGEQEVDNSNPRGGAILHRGRHRTFRGPYTE